jgi:Inositol hexakisphosphate
VSGSSINVENPLAAPYRTGCYLVYDVEPTGAEHFRSAWSLATRPYPASGSHQLDASGLRDVLQSEVVEPYGPSDLFLVDLREETHGFLDDRAASWYADNDFGNVGQSPTLIERDEEARLGALEDLTVQVFTITDDPGDNRKQQRVMPISYEEIAVGTPRTERQAFDALKIGRSTVHYARIPVTDHCGPTEAALTALGARIPVSASPADAWVHFHCHGGDGRTTTFLALYDMLCWKHSNDAFPPGGVAPFACRQCQLLPYCLNPRGCTNPDGSPCGKCVMAPTEPPWKPPLEEVRWQVLETFLQSLVRT